MSWQDLATRSETDLKLFIRDLHFMAIRETEAAFQCRKPATLWYRYLADGSHGWYWELNHLEDGHAEGTRPTPKHPSHNSAWRGGRWAKAHIQLNKGNVVGHYMMEGPK